MPVNNRFRTLAFALRDKVSDTYMLLHVVDAVMDLDTDLTQEHVRAAIEAVERPTITSPDGNATFVWYDTPGLVGGRWVHNHEYLVNFALDNQSIIASLAHNATKIPAIKALKAAVPGCGLKPAKLAIEDSRVQAAAALYSDPWATYNHNDEPPF